MGCANLHKSFGEAETLVIADFVANVRREDDDVAKVAQDPIGLSHE